MPVPPTWIPRLAEILAAVESLPSRDLDREQIMRLFGIKRRAALLLMKQLEPKMVRGSWRIDRLPPDGLARRTDARLRPGTRTPETADPGPHHRRHFPAPATGGFSFRGRHPGDA